MQKNASQYYSLHALLTRRHRAVTYLSLVEDVESLHVARGFPVVVVVVVVERTD